MRWLPRGFGGKRTPPEEIKREGWRKQNVLVIAADDTRLTWPERELVRQLGDKLYGNRPGSVEKRDDRVDHQGSREST